MNPPIARCKTLSELSDYLAFLVLYAPDDFPAWRDLTLESAFAQLLVDIDACASLVGSEQRLKELKEYAASANRSYKSGDPVNGAHALQDAIQSLKRNHSP